MFHIALRELSPEELRMPTMKSYYSVHLLIEGIARIFIYLVCWRTICLLELKIYID